MAKLLALFVVVTSAVTFAKMPIPELPKVSIDTTFNLLVLQGLEWVACVAATLSLGLRAEVTRWTAPSFTDSCLA